MYYRSIFGGMGLLCCFIGLSIYLRRALSVVQERSKERKKYSLLNLYRKGLLQDTFLHKKSGNKKIFS